MKTPVRQFTFAALVALAVFGCVTPRPLAPTATKSEVDELKARIDSAVKDRRNWVDPIFSAFW